MPGVYLVGRPKPSWHGRLIAATLACGPDAFLSHRSAAELWRMVERSAGKPVHVSVARPSCPRRPAVRVHRRADLDRGAHRRVLEIPVTNPVATLIDFATEATPAALAAAVNEASHRNLVDPETLRAALAATPSRPGIRPLRALLDRDTFVLTQSELERRFLPLARAAGLPLPESQAWLGASRVDFHWPSLGLVVECDSLRYHRTALKQAADLRRDQAHTLAGRTPFRFNHHQVRHEPSYVKASLAAVAARLRAAPHSPSICSAASSGSRGSKTK